ncbi:MAG: adenylate/guanylate cyclase domain-containing protein, partial [Acidimicrobiia bacterium]
MTAAQAAARDEDETVGERKQLTVLFADVQGSMELQEGLDPEAWAGIMSRFVQILAEGVRRFGGTVDKFTGDGIMALFGAPVAQEDHARRACHTALHLTKAIAAYAEELRASQGVDLHVRLGLNSGEVIVGRVGEDLALDPTALGHTVGLAQRMESMAEPGTAYLTDHTARLVERWFRLRTLGPTQVKGVRVPLRVFVLEGPSVSPSALRGGTTLGTAPLVGRERELAALEDALAAAAQGQAQV